MGENYGACPLGWKFPNLKIIEKALNCINKIPKEEDENTSSRPSDKTIEELKEKLEEIKNRLLAEHL